MSSQRCVTPQRRKVAVEISRPARTASASIFSVCMVTGECVQSSVLAPGDRNQSLHATPAISAAALSHWQPALKLLSGRPITVFEGTGTRAFFPRSSGRRCTPARWGRRAMVACGDARGSTGLAESWSSAAPAEPGPHGRRRRCGWRRFGDAARPSGQPWWLPLPCPTARPGGRARTTGCFAGIQGMSAVPAGRFATRPRARGHGCLLRQALPDGCDAKCTVRSRTTRSVSGGRRQ
jgi:hypothetical protein